MFTSCLTNIFPTNIFQHLSTKRAESCCIVYGFLNFMDLKHFTDLTEEPEHKRPKLFGELVPVNFSCKTTEPSN